MARADGLSGLERFLSQLRRLGWRGLALLHSSDLQGIASGASSLLSRLGSCLAVATAGLRAALGGGCEAVGPPDLPRVLGREYDYALIAVEGLLRPNLVAGVAETVRGGGALVVAAPPLDSWNPGPPGGTGLYREYLLRSLEGAGSLYWADADSGRVYAERLPASPAPRRPRGPGGFRSREGVPRPLLSLAATRGQAEGLEAFARLYRGRARSLALLGDRGRGKSFLAGLGVALAIHWHAAGRVEVVAPSPGQAAALMEGLLRGLEALGHSGRVRVRERRGGVPVRVTGPWFRVAVSTPETAEPAPLLVVDEAAAVGVARVRRLSWRSGRVVVSTTIHGYEGSGRAVAHLLLSQLPRPLERVELGEPVRYPPGDPLESWVYTTFLLDVEPPEAAPEPGAGGLWCGRVERRRLAEPGVMRRYAGILAMAHYRNEPDDILVLLEAPNHWLHAITAGGEPVAVADVAVEEPGAPEEARLGLKALEAHARAAARGLRGVRVVRIAVAPPLQRRGLGSKLLGCIEEEARRAGADVVATIFSRHEVIPFWTRNGYRPVYMSPRYNRATGEKNVALAKPLTPRGEAAVAAASSAFRLRLLLAAHSIYRDVAAERLPHLIEHSHPARAPLALTVEQRERLRDFLEGRVDYEQAADAVYVAVVATLASLGPGEIGLSREESVALAARVLQGKPLDDVAYILGVSPEEAAEKAASAARKAARPALERPGPRVG